MALRRLLTDEQWERLERLLPKYKKGGRPPKNTRLFVEAVLYVAYNSVTWRSLPREFGPWNTVYNRYRRWCEKGIIHGVFQELSKDRDDDWHSIDSTVVRAHQHATGARKQAGPQSIGKSVGGNSTKIHAKVEGLGLPVAFKLSPGHHHDVTHAPALITKFHPSFLIGDKGYDSQAIREHCDRQGIVPVIPGKKTG